MLRTEFNINFVIDVKKVAENEMADLLTILELFFVDGGGLVSWNFTAWLFCSFHWWAIDTLLLTISCLTVNRCFLINFGTTTFVNFGCWRGLAFELLTLSKVNVPDIAPPNTLRCLLVGRLIFFWFVWALVIRISAFRLVVGPHWSGFSGYNRRRDGRISRSNILSSM